MTKIRNLTGSDLTVNGILFPADSLCVQPVNSTFIISGDINGISTRKITYGKTQNLPEYVEETILIVHTSVCEANRDRTDLYFADMGSTCTRDQYGVVTSVNTLAHV